MHALKLLFIKNHYEKEIQRQRKTKNATKKEVEENIKEKHLEVSNVCSNLLEGCPQEEVK